jgi:heat shock protein HspQ
MTPTQLANLPRLDDETLKQPQSKQLSQSEESQLQKSKLQSQEKPDQ